MIQVKRAYEAESEEDGVRFLVKRLWPRGIKKKTWQLKVGSKPLHRVLSCGSGLITIQQNGTSSVSGIFGNWRSILPPGRRWSLEFNTTE